MVVVFGRGSDRKVVSSLGVAKVKHTSGCCKSFCLGVWWEVIKVEEFACVGGIIRGEAREVAEEFAWVG